MKLNPFHDKCLCESNRILNDCCLKDSRPIRRCSRTNWGNPRCYAAPLLDCSPKISREHFISEGVLRLIGERITAGGFPWLGGQERSIGINALTAKILCDQHNSTLSGLDEVGIRFFDSLRKPSYPEKLKRAIVVPRITLFRGEIIELWMLKILCGLIASGNATDENGKRIDVPLPEVWLRILFEHQPMPLGWGIYMPKVVGRSFSGMYANQIRVMNEGGVLKGLVISLEWMSFALVATHPPREKLGTLLEHCTYRPREIVLNSQMGQDILCIFWERPGDEQCIAVACAPLDRRPDVGSA
jgi:hypothetical protein